MKKNVSVFGCNLAITIAKAGLDIEDLFNKLPADPDGPEVALADFEAAVQRTIEWAEMEVEELLGHKIETVEIPVKEPEITPAPVIPEYNTAQAFNLRVASGSGGKPFCWLPHTGAHYGKNFKFVFPQTGEEFHIANGAVTQGRDGNARNYNQMFYFCGTDFKPGAAEYNGGRASVFGSPGSRARIVEVHYNR